MPHTPFLTECGSLCGLNECLYASGSGIMEDGMASGCLQLQVRLWVRFCVSHGTILENFVGGPYEQNGYCSLFSAATLNCGDSDQEKQYARRAWVVRLHCDMHCRVV